MGNSLGWYTFKNAYQEDPTILEKKDKFEMIKVYESDLAKFYGLLRLALFQMKLQKFYSYISRRVKNSAKIPSSEPVPIKIFLEFLDVDPASILFIAFSAFKMRNQTLNQKFDNLSEFTLSLWNFGTLEENTLGKTRLFSYKVN